MYRYSLTTHFSSKSNNRVRCSVTFTDESSSLMKEASIQGEKGKKGKVTTAGVKKATEVSKLLSFKRPC